MEIGIIGAGHIGGNTARQFARGGHPVVVSYWPDQRSLDHLAQQIGGAARPGTPADAAACPVVVLSVPWPMIDDALAQAGPLDGKIVIDTTNQFGPNGLVTFPDHSTAARRNATRMPAARYTKTFNTLTAGFQAEVAGRLGRDRVVQWVAGDDTDAKATVMALVGDAGYDPVDLGPTATCAVMEAPPARRRVRRGMATPRSARRGRRRASRPPDPPDPPLPHRRDRALRDRTRSARRFVGRGDRRHVRPGPGHRRGRGPLDLIMPLVRRNRCSGRGERVVLLRYPRSMPPPESTAAGWGPMFNVPCLTAPIRSPKSIPEGRWQGDQNRRLRDHYRRTRQRSLTLNLL